MNLKSLARALIVAMTVSFATLSHAQSIVSEDFTGQTTNSQWFFFNGACLTAGTATSLTSPGYVPGCASVMGSYYGVPNQNTGKIDAALVGGEKGYLGSATAPSSSGGIVPDDNGQGALRFTNGYPYGYQQRGAIVSDYTFPTTQGVQISFKTVTYLGDSGGTGKDGADGISFYLLDGCMPIAGGPAPSGCSSSPIYGSTQTFPAIGATGGSLAYSCSNSNYPFDGLVGAYLGLGVDEFGNFLNGWYNTLGETGSTGTSGDTTTFHDNTASGGLYQPGRIGLRGAGSISWQALTTAYGTVNSNGPYYPASLATTCSNGGVYSSTTNTCGVVCSSGVYNSSANTCDVCASGSTFSPSANTCGSCTAGATYDPVNNICAPAGTCSSGTYNATNNTCSTICTSGAYNSTANKCGACTSGTLDWSNYTSSSKAYCDNVCTTGSYYGTGTTYPNQCLSCSKGTVQSTTSNGVTTYSCSNSGTLSTKPLAAATLTNPTTATPTATLVNKRPTTVTPTTGAPIFTSAVQKTCATGHLWNYTNPTAPTDAGPATLSTDPTNPNSLNTAGILDYNAIPTAYSVIPTSGAGAFTIAAEGSTTRSSAAPILYNLQITQDGLLSLSYSYNGGTAVPVISSQKITNSNGPLPNSFRFGFAGSTGGDTNVHEILCFKAAPVQGSSSSGAVNVYQNPLIRTGTQIFVANYFPSDWTGQLVAYPIGLSSTQTPVVMAPAWDARCVLSGVDKATGVCDATGQSGPAAETPSSRVMLTWDPVAQVAEPFEWSSLTAAQQATLTAGDSTASANRLSYLRGDTTNEIKSTGTGFYRARDAILSDIVDSSPTFIGPPQNPYTLVSSWVDQLYPLVTQPENATGAQSYLQYMTPQSSTSNPNGEQQRPNIVYAGANDGFLHGFRAGALDVNGNLVTTTPNDGQEVLAYMPGAVLNNIHPVDSKGNVVAQLDFSNTQYSHNWYVDATPAEGDVFYNKKWHTWVVSGLGPGGAAIFALDVTDPTQFSESHASSLVIGEWTPANLTCPNQTVTACGVNLGNTYGTPQIRRFHNGQWGFVFGNGYGTANGASGIYIALLDGTTGKPTFYYFPTKLTPNAATPNGIAYPSSADLDLDHTVDYIYAGDLLGNLWKFDVTSQSPANWHISGSSPLFTAGGPITTQVTVSTVKTITTVVNSVGLDVSDAPERVVINFGTGQQVPQSLTSSATYAQGTQYLYGIWDWDMGTPSIAGSWNALSPNQQGIGLTGALQTTLSNMTEQTLTEIPTVTANGQTTGGTATLSRNPVCWSGSGTCSGTNSSMGWYTALPGTNEQIIFNPFVDTSGGALIYNTYTPSPSGVLSCTQLGATGFSLGMDASTGAGLTLPLFNVGGTSYDGVQTNAVGTGSVINTGMAGGGKNWLITHDAAGHTGGTQLNNYTVTTGQRTYWIQKR